jgi:hypothetical protein
LIQAFAELHRRFPEYQRSLQVRNAVRGRTCGLRLTDSSCLAYHCAWPSQRCKGS